MISLATCNNDLEPLHSKKISAIRHRNAGVDPSELEPGPTTEANKVAPKGILHGENMPKLSLIGMTQWVFIMHSLNSRDPTWYQRCHQSETVEFCLYSHYFSAKQVVLFNRATGFGFRQ